MNIQDILNCTKCDLSIISKPVPGAGHNDALIMFIGEAPGFNENKTGIPFVGQAGQHFNKYLKLFNINRDKVFITNVVKCRPPYNKDPLTRHLKACKIHLLNEIKQVKPLIIVLMGRIACKAFFNKDVSIKSMRFTVHKVSGINILCTYHPAFLIRNEEEPSIAIKDFEILRKLIDNYNTDYV